MFSWEFKLWCVGCRKRTLWQNATPNLSSGGSSNGWLRTLTTSSTPWAQQIRFMWQSPTTSVLQMILDNWSQPGDFESWFSVPVLFGEMQFESAQTSLVVSSFLFSERKSSRVSLSCIPVSQLPCVSNLLLLRHHMVHEGLWNLHWNIAIKISDNFPQRGRFIDPLRSSLWNLSSTWPKLLLLHNPSNEPLPHDLQRRHFDWWCSKNCTLELKTTTAFFSNPQRLPVFLELFLFTRHVVCGDATMPASTAYDHDPRLLGRSVMDQFDYVMYGKVGLGKVKK